MSAPRRKTSRTRAPAAAQGTELAGGRSPRDGSRGARRRHGEPSDHVARPSRRGPVPEVLDTGAPGEAGELLPGAGDRPFPAARDPLASARHVIEVEAQALRAMAARLDGRFLDALAILEACQGRVVVTGMGKSGLVGKKLVATLAATGTPALFLHPADGVHGDLGMVVRGDVVVALSNSGETDELLALLPALKRLGVPLVLLTGRPTSRLAQHSAVVLDVSVQEEACPMNLTPTASTAAALALADALAVALFERRGLRPEDIALWHPGGQIGRALRRVRELMHEGALVPVVRLDASLDGVIREMSGKGLGATAVVDAAERLVGIITDGDLRRALQRGVADDRARALDVMTRTPKTIGGDELAMSALELMERYAITQLLIVDGDDRVEGILHLHDLLRAKIA